MAQLKEGSTIKKSIGDEVIATLNDIPTDLSQLNQDGNNRLMTDAEKTKLGDLTYFRGLTQSQYDALSPAEKARTDVLYGVYK